MFDLRETNGGKEQERKRGRKWEERRMRVKKVKNDDSFYRTREKRKKYIGKWKRRERGRERGREDEARRRKGEKPRRGETPRTLKLSLRALSPSVNSASRRGFSFKGELSARERVSLKGMRVFA